MATEKDLSNPENQEETETVVTTQNQQEETESRERMIPDEGVPLPSSVPNVFSKQRQASIVPDPVEHQNVDVQSYLDYTGKDINLLTDDAETIRARNQGWWEQAGAFVNQAVVGEIIGGSIEGAGYLLDMEGMVDLAKGQEQEWGNWFSDIGKSIRESTQETTPIYQEDPGTFNPGDSGWWFGNGVSVASTLSLMIPSGLGLKGLSMLGRGLGSLARTTNVGSKIMRAGTKMASKAGRAAGFSEDIGKGMTQAIMSRHAENMMESSQFFEEKYNDLLDKGVSEEQARQRASEGASTVYKLDSAMLLQDLAQYTLLHRFSGGKAITPNSASKAATSATSKLKLGKYGALARDMVTEGAEEAYQHIVQEEAGYIADTSAGVRDESTFSERLQNYAKDGQLWTSAAFGAVGAGVMQGLGPSIMKRLQDRNPGFTNDPEGFMKDYTAEMSALNQSIRAAEEAGLDEQASFIKDISVARMATKNAQMGTEQGFLGMMREAANMSDEDLEAHVAKMDQYDKPMNPESIRNNAQRHLEIAQQASDKFKEIRDDYGNEIARPATSDYMMGMLNKRKAKDKVSELNDYKTSSEEYNDYSAKDELDLEIQVKALEKAKESAQRVIDEVEGDEQLAGKYQRASDNINSLLETAKEDLKKRKGKEYQSEQQKRDQQQRKGIEPFIEKASKIQSGKELSEQVANVSLESFDEKIRIANDKQKKEEKTQKAKRKADFEKNTIPAGENAVPKRGTPLTYKGGNYRYHSSFEKNGEKQHKIIKDGDPDNVKTVVSDEEFRANGEIRKSKESVADEAKEEENTKQSREEQKEINRAKKSEQDAKKPPPGPDQASGVDATPPGQRTQEPEQPTPEDTGPSPQQSDPRPDPGPQVGPPTDSVPPPGDIPTQDELQPKKKVNRAQERAQGETGGNEDIFVPPNPNEEDGQSDQHAESTPAQEISKSSTLAVSTASIRNPESWVRKDLEEGKITKNSARWKDAQAFTEWAENQSPVVDSDGSYRYYVRPIVDLDYMKSSGNYSQEFIDKVSNREPLTEEQYNNVPIKVQFFTQDNNPVTAGPDSRPVVSYLHTVGFFKPHKYGGSDLVSAKNKLFEQRKMIYSGYQDRASLKAPVVKQTDGHFLRGENVELGNFDTYNNVAEVLNQDISEITLAILNSGGDYTGADGQRLPQLDLRAGDPEKRSGAIYAHVIAANGKDKPIRLFVDNINSQEADLLYDTYSVIVRGSNPTNTLPGSIKETIRSSEDPRISQIPEAIDKSINDLTLVDIVNFLVYGGKDITKNKGQSALYTELRGEQSVLRFGLDGSINREEFDQGAKRDVFYNWVSNNRRHQVTRKLIGDNTYKRYLIDNNIIATTAAVTEDGNPLMGASTILGQFDVDASLDSINGVENANEKPPWDEDSIADDDIGMSSILQKPEISSNQSLPTSLSQRGYIRTLDRLQEKFNVPYQLIDNPEIQWAGKLDNGVAFINTAHATPDTPFHEFAHPLLQSIKETNTRLYVNLSQELQASPKGREIYGRVKRAYPDLNNEQQLDEAIVQLLGELAANNVRQDQTGLKGALQRLWVAIKRMLHKLVSADVKDTASLDPSMSMKDLSEVLSDDLTTINLSNQRISAEQRRPKWTTREEYNDWIEFMTYMFVKANTTADISDMEGAKLTTIRDLVRSEMNYLKKNDPDSRFIEQYQRVLNEVTIDGHQLNPESQFLNGVKRKLRNFGIKPDQEVDLEERDSRLNIRASYEFSNKEKASTNVKLMLAMVPQLNSTDLVMNKFARQGEPVRDYKLSENTGLPKMHSFAEMWNVVQGTLEGITEVRQDGRVEDLYRVQIDRLEKATTLRPELSFVIKHLENAPEYKRSQFTTVMAMVNQGFFSGLFQRTEDGFEFKFGRSDTQAISDQIVDQWTSSYRNKLVKVVRGAQSGERKYIVDSEKAKKLVERYDKLAFDVLEAGRNPEKFGVAPGQIPKELKREAVDLLDDIGISISERTIDKAIIDHSRGKTEISRFANILRDTGGNSIRFLFKKPKKGSKVDLSLEGMIDDPKIIPPNEDATLPMTNEAFVRKLAESESYFQNQLIDNTILGPDNKPFWVYSQFNSMFKSIAEWRRNTDRLKKIMSTAYAGNSRWGEHLLKSQENRDNFKLRTLASVRQEFSSDIGKKNTELGITDLNAVRFNAMLNGFFALPARADNTTEYYIEGPDQVKGYRVSDNNTIEASDEAVNQLKDYLLDEIARVKHAENQVKHLDDSGNPRLSEDQWIKDYHYKLDKDGDKDVTKGNAFKIDLLPSFNPDGPNGHHIFNSDGESKTLNARNFYNNPQVDQAIREAIEEQTRRDLKKIRDQRIVTNDGDTDNPNDLVNQAIDADILSDYKGEKMTETAAIHAVTMDYTVNGIIANQEWHKLFGGDIASYKSRADFQKRATGPGSTGVNYRIMNDMSSTYNSAVVEDVIRPSDLTNDENIKAIADYTGMTQKKVRDMLEAYKNVDRADAQAWITPSQYRDRMRGYGKWTPDHQNAYQRLMDGEQLPGDIEFFMDPLKTVHTEMKVDGKNLIFHYNKQSEAVLHPDLAGSMNIGNLLEAMQNNKDSNGNPNPVDHVVVESGKKVGAQGITSLMSEEGIKDSSDIELNPVALSKRFTFLQQELPTKGMKPSKEGSQLRKNILEGISADQTYTLPDGTQMDGDEFLQEMYMAIGSLSDKGLQEVKDLIGWNENLEKYDPQKLYDFLLDSMTVREENENLIDALQQKLPLDAIPQMRVAIENQLASIINKNVVDIKHDTGGAYIQMSDLGWTRDLQQGQREAVRYIKEDAKDGLKPPRVDPETGEFKPGQILIPHKVAKQLDLNELSDAELKRVMSEISTGISYRIPNQSMSSNDVVEIAGILPPELGDTVVAYKEVTTKFGSDFDIDKLNVMLPNYKIVDGVVRPHKFHDIDTTDESQLKEVYKDRYSHIVPEVSSIIAEAKQKQTTHWGDLITEFEQEDSVMKQVREILVSDTSIPTDRIDEYIDNMFTSSIEDLLNKPSLDEFIANNKGKSRYHVNSKEAVQNRKLELYRAKLSNPNTVMKMISPLESDWLQNSIKLRRMVNDGRITQDEYDEGIDSSEVANDLIDEHYDIDYRDLEAYSPTTQVEIRKTFVDTKAAVGQVANQSTDHPLAQAANLFLNRETKEGELEPYYIGIGNQVETEDGPATSFAGEFDETGDASIMETLSAFMTANVDAAKDPYITDGNFNLFTNTVALFLVRAGVSRRFIVDFIGSRSVRNLAKVNAEYEGRTGQRYRLHAKEITPLEYVTYQFSNLDTTDITEAVDISELDPRQVMKDLRETDSRQANLNALALFNHWQNFATKLSESIQASKADVNGMGPSITSAGTKENMKNKVLNDGIIGNFANKFDGTFLQSFHKNSITEGVDIFGKGTFLSHTSGHQDLIDALTYKLGMHPLTSEDIAFKLNAEAYAYIMAGSDFAVHPDEIMGMFKGTNSMAQRLMRLKGSTNEDLRSNPLIEYLGLEVRSEEGELDFVYGQGSKQMTEDAQNEITEGWKELLNHDIKEVREFALDLGKYAYYTSGFRRNLTSFHELIPVDLNNKLGIKDYIDELQLSLEKGQDGVNPLAPATDQILKNLQYDGSIVPSLSPKSPNKIADNMPTKKVFGLVPSEFEWLVTGRDESDRPVMKPYLNVGDRLYEYRGISTIEKEDGDSVKEVTMGVYTPANQLGYKDGTFRVKEYHHGISDMESVFPQNNVEKNENVEQLIRSLGVMENQVYKKEAMSSVKESDRSEVEVELRASDVDFTDQQISDFAEEYRTSYSDSLTPQEFVEIKRRDCKYD